MGGDCFVLESEVRQTQPGTSTFTELLPDPCFSSMVYPSLMENGGGSVSTPRQLKRLE